MLRGIAAYVRRHHIALLALFFALGGTAVAASNSLLPKNSVGTKQVINGSLAKADLSKKAVTALKGNKGARGIPGAAGPQGPQGAQGAQGPAGAPNPNADTVNGYAASEIARVAQASTVNRVTGLTLSTLKSVSITAPKAGFVLVTGTFEVYNPSTTCPCEIHARLRDTVANTDSAHTFDNVGNPAAPATTGFANVALSWIFPVTPGVRTFALQGAKYPAAATATLENPVINAIYVPFGASGAGTLGSALSAGLFKPQGTTQKAQ
jgi:hypothetical protein